MEEFSSVYSQVFSRSKTSLNFCSIFSNWSIYLQLVTLCSRSARIWGLNIINYYLNLENNKLLLALICSYLLVLSLMRISFALLINSSLVINE